VLLAAFVATMFVTWPQSLGGRVAYVMVSGTSMEPSMREGDLVVVRSSAGYRVGDIVAYQVPNGEVGAGMTVLHRIVGGDARAGFIMRGDGNSFDDSWRPRSAEIVGAQVARVPRVGTLVGRLRGPLPLALFAAGLAALASGGVKVGVPRRRRADASVPA
jgi:signal peptidase